MTLVSHIDWDENSFTATGPGSREGLRLIFDQSVSSRDFAQHAIMYLFREQDIHWQRLGVQDIPQVRRKGQALQPQLADIEHALCEFAKYVKLARSKGGQAPTRRGQFIPGPHALTDDLPKKWQPPQPIVAMMIDDPGSVYEVSDSDLEEDEYEVSHIVAERRCKDGSRQYCVRWIGYAPKDDTWLNEDAFATAQMVMMEWKNRPKRPHRAAKDDTDYFRQ